MTMADDLSTTTTMSRRPSKKHVAIGLAALLVVAGGITITSVTAANAAEETARQCELAVTGSKTAFKAAAKSVEQADAALEAVKSLALPGDEGWTSTDYAARAGADAVEAVAAVKASEGVEAVAAVDAVPARSSGADLVSAVADGHAGLAKAKASSECEERDQAAKISATTKKVTTDAKTLDANVIALTDDFTVFQEEERTRVAAVVEAARIAAKAEAARLAAEAEAARVATEAEAAHVAANQRAASASAAPAAPRGGGGGGSSQSGAPGSGSGGSRGAAPAPRPAPAPAPAPSRPGGGGGMGFGGGGGQCWTDNGTGGLKPC